MGELEPSFWESDCPERGAALHHTHWSKCDPKGYHPGSSEKHDWSQCCHCGRRATDPPAEPEHTSHVWNVGGKCTACGIALNTDGTPRDETYVQRVARTLVEPKAVTGNGPGGASWGRGRGSLTDRQKKRLGFVAFLHKRTDSENS